jgi:hypothetical protein
MRFSFFFVLIAALAVLGFASPVQAQQGGMLSAPNDSLGLNAPSAPAPAGTLSPTNPDYAIPGVPEAPPQDLDDADPLKNPIFLSLSPELQKQILDEAQSFYEDCTSKPSYAAMHNCECLSVHFTNERLRRPTDSTTNIGNDIERHRVDIVATSGYEYGECMRIYPTIYPQHLQKICECYGNTFARAYAKNPFPQSDYMIKIGVEAASKCNEDVGGNSFVPPPPASVIPPAPDLDDLKP